MVEYGKVNDKLSDTQLKKPKTAVKKRKQKQLSEWFCKCLMGIICLMNTCWQQGKEKS